MIRIGEYVINIRKINYIWISKKTGSAMIYFDNQREVPLTSDQLVILLMAVAKEK